MKNVVVLGMHRSGTSLVAGSLISLGLSSGRTADLLEAKPDNPKGFWERRDVVALNDRILDSAGGSWYRPVGPAHEERFRKDIEGVFDQLPGAGWVLKDPRFLITWQVWAPFFEDAAVVYVYRNPAEVADSLSRRDGFAPDYGFALWELYNRLALGILKCRSFIGVSYDRIVDDPEVELQRMADSLERVGLAFPNTTGVIDGLFDASLNRSANGSKDIDLLIAPEQLALAEACVSAVENDRVPEAVATTPDVVLRARIDGFSRMHEVSVKTVQKLRETEDHLRQERDRRIGLDSEVHELQIRLGETIDQLEEVLADNTAQAESLQQAQTELDDAEAKADYLFHTLDAMYRRLVLFSGSGAGRLSRLVGSAYKLLTFRFGRDTDFDLVLVAARQHVDIYRRSDEGTVVSRLKLGYDVLRYAIRNPVATRRNLSLPRLKRVASVFLKGNDRDLAGWVESRFPHRPLAGLASEFPVLDASLDRLSMRFPEFENPRISIVVPVFNEYRMTVWCLRSILENTSELEYEVVLADDASTDLTSSIHDRVSGIVVVRADENQRFVRNCNSAAAYARGEYLVFLNNDTSVTPGWLSPLVRLLDLDPTVGVAGPKLLFGDGRLQEAGGIIWDDASGWNYGRLDDPRKPEYNYVRECDYVSGACLLVRHSLWVSLGGFDDRFAPAYYEDTDLCFAAREAGFKVMYQPASRVFHFEGGSHGTSLTEGLKRNQLVNQGTFHEKWREVLEAEHFRNGECLFNARDRSARRRCVLVIDHYVPSFDKDAGSRATWQYLQLFVDMGYNVKFVGGNFFPHQPYTGMLEQMGVEVLAGEDMARRLSRWLNDNARNISVVYLNRPHVAEQFLDDLLRMNPRPKIVYFGHDLHYLRKEREFEVGRDPAARSEAHRWRKREYGVFQNVDRVFYPSQAEVDEIHRNEPGLGVTAIPLFVLDDEVDPPVYETSERRGVLFVGGFNHTPNIDGLRWFVDEVMPLVEDLRVHVVGSNAPSEVHDMQSESITVHGFLTEQELGQLYRKVRAAIVPLRFGAGVKGKVIEAMQYGVPVVTTSVGAEGLPEAESVLLVADSAQSFARSIQEVEEGTSMVRAKVGRYRDYLRNHFGRSVVRELIAAEFGDPVVDPATGD